MGDVPLRVRLQLLRGDLRPCRRPAQRRCRLDRDVAPWWPRQHQRFGDASSQHSSPLHGPEPAAASSRVTEPPLDLEPRSPLALSTRRRQRPTVQSRTRFLAHSDGTLHHGRATARPIVPSSLHGAFMAGNMGDAWLLVITFRASVHGRSQSSAPRQSTPAWSSAEVTSGQCSSSVVRSSTPQRCRSVRRHRCTG